MLLRNSCLVVLIILCFGCQKTSKVEDEISKIDVGVAIERFEVAFETATHNTLPQLKTRFPFLFPKGVPDTTHLAKLKDTLQQSMFKAATLHFGDLSTLNKDIVQLFQHLKFYDAHFQIPRVITVVDNVDYRQKVIVNNQLVIINLLNYLGEDHYFYQNIAKYLSKTMTRQHVISDIAERYAEHYIANDKQHTFLDALIYYGKLLYFKDVMIPQVSDEYKIGYTKDELDWVTQNEIQIWSYFVENEVLFSSDGKVISRFLAPAPFSKFYLQIDNDSPGRVGAFIGWQIVRAYAEKTEANIMDIMKTDAETIFKLSKYKPKK